MQQEQDNIQGFDVTDELFQRVYALESALKLVLKKLEDADIVNIFDDCYPIDFI